MLQNKSVSEINVILNSIYVEENAVADLKDKLQEYYNYGHCMDLAIAFNRLHGFEIEAAIIDDKDTSWIAHAWVKIPNGEYLDIMGIYQDRVELESFGGRVIENISENKLIDFTKNKSIPSSDIDKAILVAQYLSKSLSI